MGRARKLFLLLVCLVTLAELSLAVSANAANFGIGDTVEVYGTGASGLVVRGPSACDGQIGGKFDGDRGTVLSGPVYCNSYNRWKIRWSDGLEGWSAENWLRKVTVTLSLYMHDGSVSGPLLPGVRVTGSDGAGKGFDMTTDSNGLVTIAGSPGTWSFTASRAGYETVSWTKSVTASVRNDGWLVPSNKPPSCSLSSSPRSGKAPLAVTFTLAANDPDGSIASWVLDVNGDGNADYSGTGSPPSTRTYTYTNPGAYIVAFMVMDNRGAYSDACLDTINVGSNQPPTASLSANPASGAAPLTVTFSISASDPDGTITTWVLNYGDGTSDSGSGNPPSAKAHTYSSQGTYTATLAVSDNNDVIAFSTKTITVNPSAQLPSVSTYDASDVGIMSAKLNGNLDSMGGESCQIWFEYGLATSYGNSTPKELKPSAGSFSYSVSGLQSDKTYHFRACASNSKGTVCGSDKTFTTAKPVNQPPSPPTNLDQFMSDGVTPISTGTVTYEKSVVFRGDLSDPDGDNVQLQIELRLTYDYSGGFLYGRTHWSDFVSSGGQANVPAEGLPNGRYHWQARAVDKYGLASEWVEFGNNPTSAADFLLFVNSLPFASFTYSPAYPDVGQEVTFDASASYDPDGGPISYGWDFGDGSTATGKVAKHTYSETGSYTINLTVTDDEGTRSKYHAEIGVFSAVLGESINRLVSETDKVLDNDILANAKNVGLATDFLAKKVLNEKIGMVTGLIFDLLGYLPVFKVEQVSALSVGQYVRLAEKFPVLTELVDNYGWVAVKISVDQFLMMTEEVTSDIMSKLSSNGYSYSNAFVPDLEAEIINKKGNLTYLKNEVLGSISGLDGERISLYQKDLQKRISANRALGTIYFTKALLPVTLKDIKEDASTGWDIVLGKILYTLLKSVVSIGTSGWSSAVIKVGSIAIDLYNKKSQLNSDEEALWYASGTLFDGFAQTELISRNAYQGLKNIRDSVVPSSAEGGIISIENIAVGDFWNKDRVHYNEISFFARKIYSNVTIENTGDIKTEYKLVARYTRPFKFEVIVPIPFGVDLPFIASEEEEIGPHQTKTFSVWYKNDDYGGGSSPGDHDIYFELFGITDNGIYFLDLKPTRYGTTKIVTNGVNVSEEELENASMFSYPIMSEFDNATLYIYTENPFEFPIQANLTQEIPSSLDVISARNGTINGTNISWQLELKPDEREMVNITLKSAGALDTIEIPGAVLEIYDQVNDQWLEFASNNVSLNVKNLMGDTDGNCKVDIFDLAAVGLCYGQQATGSCQNADLNSDGKVNIFDLATVGLNYGRSC